MPAPLHPHFSPSLTPDPGLLQGPPAELALAVQPPGASRHLSHLTVGLRLRSLVPADGGVYLYVHRRVYTRAWERTACSAWALLSSIMAPDTLEMSQLQVCAHRTVKVTGAASTPPANGARASWHAAGSLPSV
ncbi:hypothetical protein PAL_GLEAN10015752 [Pteropus alecto]|uniref:Uncharacterized protein n=1 Tax=Pteropus alecto TaxID=9402 RepID=L5L0I4_PTEAL|nr:hypothetical protein PAL_GLEAN10015752 [Pteropus alecto]